MTNKNIPHCQCNTIVKLASCRLVSQNFYQIKVKALAIRDIPPKPLTSILSDPCSVLRHMGSFPLHLYSHSFFQHSSLSLRTLKPVDQGHQGLMAYNCVDYNYASRVLIQIALKAATWKHTRVKKSTSGASLCLENVIMVLYI